MWSANHTGHVPSIGTSDNRKGKCLVNAAKWGFQSQVWQTLQHLGEKRRILSSEYLIESLNNSFAPFEQFDRAASTEYFSTNIGITCRRWNMSTCFLRLPSVVFHQWLNEAKTLFFEDETFISDNFNHNHLETLSFPRR